MTARRILVTSALPYANGHIHIGHLVEYLQTDIWVRFQKLRGHDCRYMCADDTHGTAVMIRARQEERSETDLIAEMSQEHQRDFAAFDIAFDNYGSTNSESNRTFCHEIWAAIRGSGMVHEKEVEQLFDPKVGTFLADRFVKGTCPKCGAADQYGDSCDKCGAVYSPADLKGAKSTLSGAVPELRKAMHLFVEVEQLHEWLNEWTSSGSLQPEVANYLKGHFLGEPLRNWDISRPAPYFGFEIPDAPGHYWYVWFDAPIGYIASTKEWCERTGEDFDTWWKTGDGEVHHFIGKDITYFHTLFWPAMLKTAGFKLPDKVHIHGFLTVNGEKMSKSKGTFVRAADYARHLDTQALRYYYASKLGNTVDDIDLSLEEFVNKVNSDLVGKVVNLASRTARFIREVGLGGEYPQDQGLFANAAAQGESIARCYEECRYSEAMRQIMTLADRANEFVEASAPWILAKDPERAADLQRVCTIALNLFRQLVVYLAPVLPRLWQQVDDLFTVPIGHWHDAQTPLTGLKLAPFQHLMQRVQLAQVQAMIDDSRIDEPAAAVAPDDDQALVAEPLAELCHFDDFMQVDLRVVRVVAAEVVPKSKKLLRLRVSLGGDEQREVLAGIKAAYKPEDLVGRLLLYVANLAPREMGKFGTSHGMIAAAGPGGEELFVFAPDSGAKPGQRVH
jgi:methionyl-tRNA synthetase